MAVLVTEIFATWAMIEHEMALMLVHVLGADSEPAIAMHATLTAQHLQMGALQAAAKAALSADDYQIFQAAISVVESTQTPRNQLAHWIWGTCKQRPDLLVLADPRKLKVRNSKIAKALESKAKPQEADLQFSPTDVLAYSEKDLSRSLRDLKECFEIVQITGDYLHFPKRKMLPKWEGADEPPAAEEISAALLQTLSSKRLFREAADRIRKGQNNSQQ